MNRVHRFSCLVLACCALIGAGRVVGAPAEGEAAAKLEEARAALGKRDFRRAIDAYRKANKLAGGNSADCLLGLATAYNQLGATSDALDSARQAVAATADKKIQEQAYNQAGIALFHRADGKSGRAMDDVKAAEEAFRKALEASDGHFELARFNLGRALLRQSRDAEGLATLREFLDRQPTGPVAAEAKALMEEPRRAREDFAPDYAVVTLDGKYLSFADLKGKVVVLDFWATWCSPCVAALPALKQLAKKLAAEPFVLVSLSGDADGDRLRAFLAKHPADWPQVWDQKKEASQQFQITQLPTYFVLDPEGRVIWRHSGWGSTTAGELDGTVHKALKALHDANPAAR
ncbi:MAG TPA: redoxin domain-containing protein [Thermoanaerobaculia bacterium]|nr:redoxin domain-containing protein [Thermoanaerobaculia bacterium]